MDTISESGFKLSKLSLGQFSFYRNRKKPRSQSININPLTVVDTELSFDGAMFYLTYSNGLCGNLSFGKKSILFEIGKDFDETQPTVSPQRNLEPKCPIEEEAIRNSYEIDFLNIGEVYVELSNDHKHITIFCCDFRHVKISLRQCEKADAIIEKLRKLSFDNMVQLNMDSRISLWEYLFNNYPYRVNSDWVQHEKWYISNFKIRLSAFNEIGQISSLPQVVIVPRGITDVMLDRLSSISVGNRVPLITYLHRQSSHMIVRCTSFKDNNFIDLMAKNITPLRELSIDAIFADLNDLEKHYAKLRKHCFSVVNRNKAKQSDPNLASFHDIDHESKFWSKCNPWLTAVAKVLRFVSQLSSIVQNEASIALVESYDSRWNCVLSSLVQMVIDPHRRTIAGFESLISKEWIYLSGYKSRISQNSPKYRVANCPNTALFILFLDCVHQLILQNPRSFEFTTIYLISLADAQFATENFKREMAARFECNKQHSSIRSPLFLASEDVPQIDGHITKICFFYMLFFRHLKSDILKFSPQEGHLYSELHNRSLF